MSSLSPYKLIGTSLTVTSNPRARLVGQLTVPEACDGKEATKKFNRWVSFVI
jgi:hypothetical protein